MFTRYNLNSVLSEPAYVSETYLSILLAQMEQEGYSIFVVSEDIPLSDADSYCESVPEPDEKQLLQDRQDARKKQESSKKGKEPIKEESKTGTEIFGGKGYTLGTSVDSSGNRDGGSLDDDEDGDEEEQRALKRAIEMSIEEGAGDVDDFQFNGSSGDIVDAELEAAILMSLSDGKAAKKRENQVHDSGTGIGTETETETEAERIRRKRMERFQ